MSISESTLASLKEQFERGGTDAALDGLVDELRAGGRHHELFDALLMRSRHRLGLPLAMSTSIDDLREPLRSQLEDAYLEACRDVGSLLLAEGKLREAWMYLRPTGDKAALAAALERVAAEGGDMQEMVELALHEGIAPVLGYKLVLDHYGTCNAISTFEGAFMGRPRSDQQAAAGMLVRHVHHELLGTLRADIARREGAEPPNGSVAELIAGRDWLFEDQNYHLDTSHLAATVRLARLLDDKDTLRLALELTEYGGRLSPQFQFPGEEPFVELYPSHALFFRAALGEQVDEALEYFRERAVAADFDEQGSAPAETYIALLARAGRYREAIEASRDLIPAGRRSAGYAPSLLDLSRLAGDFGPMLELCAQRGDVLGYMAALVESKAT